MGSAIKIRLLNKMQDYFLEVALDHLKECRPEDVPQHSEKILPAVTSENKRLFINLLSKRLQSFTASQLKRVAKVMREAETC